MQAKRDFKAAWLSKTNINSFTCDHLGQISPCTELNVMNLRLKYCKIDTKGLNEAKIWTQTSDKNGMVFDHTVLSGTISEPELRVILKTRSLSHPLLVVSTLVGYVKWHCAVFKEYVIKVFVIVIVITFKEFLLRTKTGCSSQKIEFNYLHL